MVRRVVGAVYEAIRRRAGPGAEHSVRATNFLTDTLPRVGTEMSLHVLAYNLKRVIAIVGVALSMKAMSA